MRRSAAMTRQGLDDGRLEAVRRVPPAGSPPAAVAVEPAAAAKPAAAHPAAEQVLHVERAAAEPAAHAAHAAHAAKVVVARHAARRVVLVDALVELGPALRVRQELVRRLDLQRG